ncbi:MBL fold metallo-hydrolase [Kribbella catacumbae]|uniref:MBL fold metallo-hydrolase n=1 Tax=Kribbella catacumbae TaxID=460086 RepID=UPI00036AA21E|nr:MBL fold metallo-hydrolase [Kribbella catacumbae]
MDLTHYGHACVLAELPVGERTVRLLFDPGTYSADFDSLLGIDVVLITHAHPDHLDGERLGRLLANNPEAEVVLGAHCQATLGDQGGIAQDRMRVVGPGDKVRLRGVDVEVVGGEHACIHSELPIVPNNGYLINGGSLLHPGDALDEVSAPVDVLLLPIGGPWMKIGEGVDYLRAVAPRLAVPIHQAGLAPIHQNMHCSLLRDLAPAETELLLLEHGVSQPLPTSSPQSKEDSP